jgi:hypothetical protein
MKKRKVSNGVIIIGCICILSFLGLGVYYKAFYLGYTPRSFDVKTWLNSDCNCRGYMLKDLFLKYDFHEKSVQYVTKMLGNPDKSTTMDSILGVGFKPVKGKFMIYEYNVGDVAADFKKDLSVPMMRYGNTLKFIFKDNMVFRCCIETNN